MYYVFLALLSGIGTTLQGNINTLLRVSLNNSLLAALLNFVVGTLALLIIVLMVNNLNLSWSQVQAVPWWQWTGGLIGAFFVYSIIVALPKLGSGNMFSLIITGQILFAVLLDHWGLLGSTVHTLSLPRLLGVFLLIAGVWLIQKY